MINSVVIVGIWTIIWVFTAIILSWITSIKSTIWKITVHKKKKHKVTRKQSIPLKITKKQSQIPSQIPSHRPSSQIPSHRPSSQKQTELEISHKSPLKSSPNLSPNVFPIKKLSPKLSPKSSEMPQTPKITGMNIREIPETPIHSNIKTNIPQQQQSPFSPLNFGQTPSTMQIKKNQPKFSKSKLPFTPEVEPTKQIQFKQFHLLENESIFINELKKLLQTNIVFEHHNCEYEGNNIDISFKDACIFFLQSAYISTAESDTQEILKLKTYLSETTNVTQRLYYFMHYYHNRENCLIVDKNKVLKQINEMVFIRPKEDFASEREHIDAFIQFIMDMGMLMLPKAVLLSPKSFWEQLCYSVNKKSVDHEIWKKTINVTNTHELTSFFELLLGRKVQINADIWVELRSWFKYEMEEKNAVNDYRGFGNLAREMNEYIIRVLKYQKKIMMI